MTHSYGELVESSVSDIASSSTLPDFVFRAKDVPKGKATREVGDLLLLVGRRLLVVAIKSREPSKQSADSPQRAAAWRRKAIDEAADQIRGTIRTLNETKSDLVLRSDRGVDLPWDPAAVDEIFGVIVVDYARADDYYPNLREFPVPLTVMETRDWEWIHTRLLRANAVINYINIRAKIGITIPFGSEAVLLEQIIQAESAGELAEVTADELVKERWYKPPTIPSDDVFGSMEDHRFALVIREMIESAADQSPEFASFDAAHEYLHIVSFLDAIPLMHQVELGKKCIEKATLAREASAPQSLLARTPHGPFVFCATPGNRDKRVKFILALTKLRHTQLSHQLNAELATLGIATEPTPSAGRSYDFCLVSGDAGLTHEQLAKGEELLGPAPPYESGRN